MITKFILRDVPKGKIADRISQYTDIMLREMPPDFDPDEDPCQMFKSGRGRWAMPYCAGHCEGGGSCQKVEIWARSTRYSDIFDVTVKCVCQ
jgi:hypothetical protein